MSPDGKYIAMTRNYNFGILDYTDFVEHRLSRGYSYNEGVYIKNMLTDGLTPIAPLVDDFGGGEFSQKPIQWVYVNKDFDNNKNRWCFPIDSESEFKVSDSCNTYCPERVLDGNPNTAWIEDEERYNGEYEEMEEKYDGKGIGEWIKIYKYTNAKLDYMKFKDRYRTDAKIGYMESFRLSGIKIINGYAKNKEEYSANSRVKKAEIILSDGTSYIFNLKDNNLGFQTLDFGEEIETRQVVIKILDIYEGNKYNDTCISEVEFIGVN